MASRTAQALAEAYFEAWSDKDFDAVRVLLNDDVTFQGSFVSLRSAEDVFDGITQLGGLVPWRIETC